MSIACVWERLRFEVTAVPAQRRECVAATHDPRPSGWCSELTSNSRKGKSRDGAQETLVRNNGVRRLSVTLTTACGTRGRARRCSAARGVACQGDGTTLLPRPRDHLGPPPAGQWDDRPVAGRRSTGRRRRPAGGGPPGVGLPFAVALALDDKLVGALWRRSMADWARSGSAITASHSTGSLLLVITVDARRCLSTTSS